MLVVCNALLQMGSLRCVCCPGSWQCCRPVKRRHGRCGTVLQQCVRNDSLSLIARGHLHCIHMHLCGLKSVPALSCGTAMLHRAVCELSSTVQQPQNCLMRSLSPRQEAEAEPAALLADLPKQCQQASKCIGGLFTFGDLEFIIWIPTTLCMLLCRGTLCRHCSSGMACSSSGAAQHPCPSVGS